MSDSVHRINEAYHAGVSDGMAAQSAAWGRARRACCHWCNVILVNDDAGEHLSECEKNPHREKFETLDALLRVLTPHMAGGETPVQTAERLASMALEKANP